MSNEVPVYLRWELWHFVDKFINIIFTKVALTSFVGRKEVFYRLGLGDCDKLAMLRLWGSGGDYLGYPGI